jgi:hypothetical protein
MNGQEGDDEGPPGARGLERSLETAHRSVERCGHLRVAPAIPAPFYGAGTRGQEVGPDPG